GTGSQQGRADQPGAPGHAMILTSGPPRPGGINHSAIPFALAIRGSGRGTGGRGHMADHALRTHAAGSSRIPQRLGQLGAGLALVALVMLALAPLGWRAGWWHFRTSFFYLMTYGAYVAAAAAVVSLIALVVALV